MACRNLARSQSALETIQKAANSKLVHLMELDLSSLQSVKNFTETFRSKFNRLDGLINNAGPVGAERMETKEGFETHFGVAHLGHFALTGHLLDVLLNTPDSRIVTVGSRMHAGGEINWDDLMGEKSYDRWKAYSQSKLANTLFALALSRKLQAKGSGTKSIVVHPGLVKSNWADNNLSGLMKLIAKIMAAISYQSAEMGALPSLFAVVDPAAKNGGYYGPDNDSKGFPVETQLADAALSEPDAERLWALSEELIGIKYPL
jgi:NAD(P)-dependent dehydrogenase (short-subunit alcohol dehydrogenase family)